MTTIKLPKIFLVCLMAIFVCSCIVVASASQENNIQKHFKMFQESAISYPGCTISSGQWVDEYSEEKHKNVCIMIEVTDSTNPTYALGYVEEYAVKNNLNVEFGSFSYWGYWFDIKLAKNNPNNHFVIVQTETEAGNNRDFVKW